MTRILPLKNPWLAELLLAEAGGEMGACGIAPPGNPVRKR